MSVLDDLDPPAATERLMTTDQVCEMIGVNRVTLWRWCRAGKFPTAIDVNGHPRWRLSELSEWLAERPKANTKANTND